MASSVKLKEVYEVESKHGSFYTGGHVEWHNDTIYCQTPSNINLLNVEDGTITKKIGGNDSDEENSDSIHIFTTDGDRVITSHKSGLFKMWNSNGEIVKIWKYIHKGPVAKLCLRENILASGGADGAVRIWDLEHQACVLSLRGCSGVVNVVEFAPEGGALFASGDDGKIISWELLKGEQLLSYVGHFSKITSLVFTPQDNKHFVTCGRDKVIILWEIGNPAPVKTIPTYEAVEKIISLPIKFKLPDFKSNPEVSYIASAGELGKIRIWDILNAKEVYQQQETLVTKAPEGELAISHLVFNKTSKTIGVITVDHNILLYHLKSFVCLKQFIGFTDEILDITFLGPNDSHLAVATNSNDIKLYHNSTMNCQILKGHSDIVLTLNVNKNNSNLMISGSKDNSIRLWLLDNNVVRCISVGKRHNASIGSVWITNHFITSVSQDSTLKTWQVPENTHKIREITNLTCLHTEIAHQKDINSVTVSPNDKIIATASQDKTAKLWTESLSLVGVLRGHKRGVWSLRFSPVDQIIATSSADCTIKLWSVTELNCLKTIEGHDASVLRLEFLSNGLQILSTGADGLIKIFNIKTSECQVTLDEHEGRIWALATSQNEAYFVTGAADSCLIKWKDVTEDKKLEKLAELEAIALEEQKLSNYLQNNQLLKALKLALKLDRPFQVLKIVHNIIKNGDTGLSDTIHSLKNDQKEKLLKCATTWNTNSKNCQPAQLVINILINELQMGDFRPIGLSHTIESVLPYTERHYKRLTQLMQNLYFIDYTVQCMKPHAKKV